MCLTVYEFSFILLIHHIILLIFIFVLSVTFWTSTYYKIWILLIIYYFIWNYWIICFASCLKVYVLECVEKIWALLRSLHWLYSNCKFQGLFWSIRYKHYRLSMIYSGLFFYFCVICVVELLVFSVTCRLQGLSYLHVPDCIWVFFYLFIHHSIIFLFWIMYLL